MKFPFISKVITSLFLVLVSFSLISGTASKSKNIKKVQTYWDEVW